MSKGGGHVSEPTKCKTCEAWIRWVRSAKSGKPIPLNAPRVPFITERGLVIYGYVPHWATCPDADKHRRDAARGLSFIEPS